MPGSTTRIITVAVLGSLTLALVLAAVVLLSRQSGVAPIRIVSPTPSAEAATPTVPGVSAPPAAEEIRVYVSGAVVNPGVYPLGPDDRIADAIAAAGGETGDAESTGLNMAARVRDEARYHIPKTGEDLSDDEPEAASQGDIQPEAASRADDEAEAASQAGVQPEAAVSNTQADGGPIDLNLASTVLLETLPGIGPALTKAIVDYREDAGPFRSVDEIVNVPRIGPATLNNIRELVTVSGSR